MLTMESDSPNADPEPAEEVRYFPVSAVKLGVMSVFTFGIYQLYWFYKTWSQIKTRDDSEIWPIVRAVFAPATFPLFLRDLTDEEARSHDGDAPLSAPSPLGPSVGYVMLNLCWALPGLLSWLGLLSFVPMLPALRRVNVLNGVASSAYAQNSRWRVQHVLLCVAMAPLLAFGIAGDVGLLPTDAVLPGSALAEPVREELRAGVLRQGEEVQYFYFQNPFSPSEGGSLLTDQGVVSYRPDPEEGEIKVERASFSSIRAVEVDYGFATRPTVLTIEQRSGRMLTLELSPADGGDQVLVEELATRLPFGTKVTTK